MIWYALPLLFVLLYITRFPDLVPDEKTIIWLIWHLPHTASVWLCARLHRTNHTGGGLCLPCEIDERVRHAHHEATVGPARTVYCTKCGLDSWKWPQYCANKVVQVNNQPQRRAQAWYKPVFWD